MNETPQMPPGPARESAVPLASVLDELEAVLTRQLSHAGRGDYDAVAAEADRAAALLRGARAALPPAPAPGSPPDPEQARRLQRAWELHKRLRLKIALQRADASQRLGRFGRSRKAARAYAGAAGR